MPDRETVLRIVKMLLACYPMAKADDPEGYIAALASIMEGYPTWILYQVIHPRTGLPGRLKWLPTASELRDACERLMEPERARAAAAWRLRGLPRPTKASDRISPEKRVELAEMLRGLVRGV